MLIEIITIGNLYNLGYLSESILRKELQQINCKVSNKLLIKIWRIKKFIWKKSCQVKRMMRLNTIPLMIRILRGERLGPREGESKKRIMREM